MKTFIALLTCLSLSPVAVASDAPAPCSYLGAFNGILAFDNYVRDFEVTHGKETKESVALSYTNQVAANLGQCSGESLLGAVVSFDIACFATSGPHVRVIKQTMTWRVIAAGLDVTSDQGSSVSSGSPSLAGLSVEAGVIAGDASIKVNGISGRNVGWFCYGTTGQMFRSTESP
jgi:hypothetical protein